MSVMRKKDGELDGGIVTVDDEGELEESFDNNVRNDKEGWRT